MRIFFEDKGQDVLWFEVEPDGDDYRITDCLVQQFVWVGLTLVRASVKKGQQPVIERKRRNGNVEVRTFNYRVTEIETPEQVAP